MLHVKFGAAVCVMRKCRKRDAPPLGGSPPSHFRNDLTENLFGNTPPYPRRPCIVHASKGQRGKGILYNFYKNLFIFRQRCTAAPQRGAEIDIKEPRYRGSTSGKHEITQPCSLSLSFSLGLNLRETSNIDCSFSTASLSEVSVFAAAAADECLSASRMGRGGTRKGRHNCHG